MPSNNHEIIYQPIHHLPTNVLNKNCATRCCGYPADSSDLVAGAAELARPPLPLHSFAAGRIVACGSRPAWSRPVTRAAPASCTRLTLPSLGSGVGCPQFRLRPTVTRTVHLCLRTHSPLRLSARPAAGTHSVGQGSQCRSAPAPVRDSLPPRRAAGPGAHSVGHGLAVTAAPTSETRFPSLRGQGAHSG